MTTSLKVYSGSKVLITGNTGFKGTWLTSLLLQLGAKVIGVASFSGRRYDAYERLQIRNRIDQRELDVCNYPELEKLIYEEKPEFIFHLAAQAITLTGLKKPLYTLQTNVIGTTNVLEAIRNAEYACNVVIITSDKCYENKEWYWSYRETDRLFGADPYGASKSMAENVTWAYYNSYFKRESGVKVCTARAGNVFGGGDWSDNRLVPDCIRAWTDGQQIEVRSPHSTRPWSFVLDVLYGYLVLGVAMNNRYGLSGESFNFGPSSVESVSVSEFVGRLWSFYQEGNNGAPMKLVTPTLDQQENELLKLSSDKAAKILAWKPLYDLSTAMSLTVSWYKEFLNRSEDVQRLTDSQVSEYLKTRGHDFGTL